MNPIDKDMQTDLNLPMVGRSSGNEHPTDQTYQGKHDNDFVDKRAKYVTQ